MFEVGAKVLVTYPGGSVSPGVVVKQLNSGYGKSNVYEVYVTEGPGPNGSYHRQTYQGSMSPAAA